MERTHNYLTKPDIRSTWTKSVDGSKTRARCPAHFPPGTRSLIPTRTKTLVPCSIQDLLYRRFKIYIYIFFYSPLGYPFPRGYSNNSYVIISAFRSRFASQIQTVPPPGRVGLTQSAAGNRACADVPGLGGCKGRKKSGGWAYTSMCRYASIPTHTQTVRCTFNIWEDLNSDVGRPDEFQLDRLKARPPSGTREWLKRASSWKGA